MTAIPSSAESRRTSVSISSRPAGSSPLVGSSRITSSGEWTIAWARFVRCFMPIEKVRISRERSSSSPTWNSTSDARSTATRRGRPRSSPMWTTKSRAVMPIGQARVLGHVAEQAPDLPGLVSRVDAEHPYLAGVGRDQAEHRLHRASTCRRRLRRAGRAPGLVTEVDTSSSAVTCPNRLVTPAASISGCSEAVTFTMVGGRARRRWWCRRPSIKLGEPMGSDPASVAVTPA